MIFIIFIMTSHLPESRANRCCSWYIHTDIMWFFAEGETSFRDRHYNVIIITFEFYGVSLYDVGSRGSSHNSRNSANSGIIKWFVYLYRLFVCLILYWLHGDLCVIMWIISVSTLCVCVCMLCMCVFWICM